MKYFLILFFIPTMAFAECRYKMIEQNGTYFAVKKVLGNLPSEEQEIKGELKVGINNVKVVNKEDDPYYSPDPDVRVKVRFKSKDKKEVQNYVQKFCP